MQEEWPMRRSTAGIRPAYGLTGAALAALALSLAGCGVSPAGGSASAGHVSRPKTASSADSSLALSHMKILTQLKQPQLCGLLTPAATVQALGGPASPPLYSSNPHQGVSCQWVRHGSAADANEELAVSISATVNWTGTQAVDKLLHASSVTVDGRPGMAVAWQATLGWAQVDVALGGAGDPVAQYRAPTMAGALALAKAGTARIVAYG
jgi:hypothetical protein